ncbi:MAG: M20/M25/M40 family metallo-hydrolase [Thermodesulfobacteriota bacterium]
MTVNRERLADTFRSLVTIDSESRDELAVSGFIAGLFSGLGATIVRDDSLAGTGSNSGNMVARFEGRAGLDPLLIAAHMDTVSPGRGIAPVFKDGVFFSSGETILGSDDKSAIAVMHEAMCVLKESGVDCCPLELVFTVCEEIGLVGAKHFDYGLLRANRGYVLDTSDPASIVVQAPAANRLEFVIHGKDAHAGARPEDGVNAISVAARAIARLEPGRVDPETTYNIGTIEGGQASNIVPAKVIIRGEARSRNDDKLEKLTDQIVAAFRETVAEAAARCPHAGYPSLDVSVVSDFKSLNIPPDHPVVTTAVKAARTLGFEIRQAVSGGGSDANIFFQHGITAGVLGTGMKDIHSVRENVALDDMVRAAELLVEIIKASA